MKAMILRIGIDKGTDGTLAPIFEDGSFEYIPISEGDARSREDRTYKNTMGRTGKPLAAYLPKAIENRTLHYDPEFETFTYGDPTAKRTYLLKLEKGDLLVFYAGLTPYQTTKYETALYIIGYFTVDEVIDFNTVTRQDIQARLQRLKNNAHLKRRMNTTDLVIVSGEITKSRLLTKAIRISEPKPDAQGRPYQAVSHEMEQTLGIKGSIQRSIPPRTIREPEKITNLKKILALP